MKLGTIKLLCGLICLTILVSCNDKLKTGEQLSNKETEFIRKLGLLDTTEKILLFDTQGGFDGLKMSGNFFSDKRLASYWLDKYDKNKTSINYAFYHEIDTIIPIPRINSLTYASYLTILKKDGQSFKVYVASDSITTWDFMNRAIDEWLKNK